jgi:hypothetical protein
VSSAGHFGGTLSQSLPLLQGPHLDEYRGISNEWKCRIRAVCPPNSGTADAFVASHDGHCALHFSGDSRWVDFGSVRRFKSSSRLSGSYGFPLRSRASGPRRRNPESELSLTTGRRRPDDLPSGLEGKMVRPRASPGCGAGKPSKKCSSPGAAPAGCEPPCGAPDTAPLARDVSIN